MQKTPQHNVKVYEFLVGYAKKFMKNAAVFMSPIHN